jgi:hypothetical protein
MDLASLIPSNACVETACGSARDQASESNLFPRRAVLALIRWYVPTIPKMTLHTMESSIVVGGHVLYPHNLRTQTTPTSISEAVEEVNRGNYRARCDIRHQGRRYVTLRDLNFLTEGVAMAKEETVIEFIFDEEGNVTAEKTCGESGPTCEKEIDEILSAVGTKTKTRRKTEYYQTVRVGAIQQRRQK